MNECELQVQRKGAVVCNSRLSCSKRESNGGLRVQICAFHLFVVGYVLPQAQPKRPAWLETLLNEKFFTSCSKHAALKKNERNIFCVDCSDSICQHCLPAHRTHRRVLQIRRYVYHDVIRLQDIQKLVDCAQVQTYIINSARVVFLNQRPQPRPSKGLGNACETCERSLQDSYRYCSVACKIDSYMNQEKDIQNLLPPFTTLQSSDFFSCSPSESLKSGKLELDEDLSPHSTLCEPLSQTSSDSSGTAGVGCGTVTSTATTLQPPKKHRSSRPSPPATSPKSVILASSNRRKGTPHRSPLW
ncbi:hypothetical protein R1sor_017717 [Riccia sorocarpa]|uniref:B box-type domain-containing protein n=1 Tax=Riccia sorocarpa TaxID=122646 RepID=A0ABD3IBB7_9MARC